MPRALSRLFLLCVVPLALGCTQEAKTRKALETYETVFRACKEETEKAKMKPGEHPCSAISSLALDMGLEQHGLDAAKRQEMLKSWLEKKKFVEYYLPAEKRPATAAH